MKVAKLKSEINKSIYIAWNYTKTIFLKLGQQRALIFLFCECS